MKKGLMVAIVALTTLFCGCHKQSEPIAIKVTVANIDQFDGKSTFGEVVDIKNITLAFFKQSDHSLVCQYTQSRSDYTAANIADFGVFDLLLDQGAYDMVVVAHSCNDHIVINNFQSFALAYPSMVFLATQTVAVSSFGSSNITADLHRVSSQLRVDPTDAIPSWADHIEFTFSASGNTFNPTTGLATTNTGISGTLNGLSGYVGRVESVTCNMMLYTNEQTMNVTIGVYDSQNNLVLSNTIENIPFMRNRRTYISGALYHQNSGTGFTVNTEWITDHNGGTF